jgi:acetyl esterase/lipase
MVEHVESREAVQHEDGHPGPSRPRRRWLRVLLWIGIPIVAVLVVISIVTSLTPWPSAMAIRSVFERGGAQTVAEMEPYVPDAPLREQLDIAYAPAADGANAADTTMDVFTPAAAGDVLPTVVWVHGGAWISGSKADVDPYLRILANEGYTTIGVNYTLGPEGAYPIAITQLNDALAYIDANAEELGVDASRIVLAGDSAGGQLASQLAVLMTNPRYADIMGMDPALQPDQLVGAILNCGVYSLPAMAELDGIVAWGFQVALWAYTGTKNWSASYEGATMSTIEWVTEDFPPTYISGGNGDGLTWLQSIPMSQRLRDVGVDVTDLFWPAQHEPALPHEYQFHLDLPEAREALAETIAYLAEVTG